MKPQSRLELNKAGGKVLIVYYSMALNDYDSQIERAEIRFGVKDDASVTVICLPERSKLQSSQVWKRRPIRQSR